MWRGVTPCKPILSGATMVRAGWLTTGKLVAYPIRENIDGEGRQLMNWLADAPRSSWTFRWWTRTRCRIGASAG